jgi:Holliday junction resolvasome RuvABC DNA-binding subunit
MIDNASIAGALERVSDLLEAQRAEPHRVRAYRRAAHEVRQLARPCAEIFEHAGHAGLERIPGVGPSIGSAIEELLHTGQLRRLDRLEGQVSPEDLFATVPGIGEELAHRIHEELHIDTLEDLELAAHDGRLDALPGFGRRRVQAICHELDAMLRRTRAQRTPTPAPQPTLPTLLSVDADYRALAAEGALHKIAPRRFNPRNVAWLPVLHVDRDGWHLTAMFSNTATAHRLHKTTDWVVIYYEQDGREGQCTVVTEYRGPLAGQRVVRGREREHQSLPRAAPPQLDRSALAFM